MQGNIPQLFVEILGYQMTKAAIIAPSRGKGRSALVVHKLIYHV